MNESMRSVADIPGDDVEDDLSGISPELVLIDPELARLMRERERASAYGASEADADAQARAGGHGSRASAGGAGAPHR